MFREHRGGPASHLVGGGSWGTLPRDMTVSLRPKEQGYYGWGEGCDELFRSRRSRCRSPARIFWFPCPRYQQLISANAFLLPGSEALPLLAEPGGGVGVGAVQSPSSWWPLDPHAPGLLSCTLQGASPCSLALFIFLQRHFRQASLVAQMVKNLPAYAGDVGSVHGSGSSPRGGNGNQFQYSCLGNPMDRGAGRATVHGVARVRHH